MKKSHLMQMLDILIALALFKLAEELPFPYPRTLAGFWQDRQTMLRILTSMLWLAGLWFNLYQVRDKVQRINGLSLISGMVLMLCVLLTPYATNLIVQYRARLVFQLYGGLTLLSATACYTLLWTMERNSDIAEDCVNALRNARKTLAVAFILLTAGMACCFIRYRQVMWYAVWVVAIWLLIAPISIFRSRQL